MLDIYKYVCIYTKVGIYIDIYQSNIYVHTYTLFTMMVDILEQYKYIIVC